MGNNNTKYVYEGEEGKFYCKKCHGRVKFIWENQGYDPPEGPSYEEVVGHKCQCGEIRYE